MYNEIKQNIINNFFNPNYKYTVYIAKKFIIDSMETRCIFPCTYNEDMTIFTVTLGDGISIEFHFDWEHRDDTYRLVSIS